jgi:hypothetical protein
VDIVADLQQSPCFCAGIRRFNFTGVAGFATVRIPGGRGISLSNHFYPEAAGQALCGLFICARQAFPNSPSRASMLACPSLPAADRKIGNDCWHIYYGDVHAGTIAMPVGNPSDTDPWEWSCGFYPRVNSIRHVGARQQTGV